MSEDDAQVAEAAVDEKTSKVWLMKFPAQHPNKACCCGCCCHLSFFLIYVVLTMAMGTQFFNMATALAYHLWDMKFQELGDAIVEGKKICTFDPTKPEEQEQQVYPQGQLMIVYEASDGNMVEKNRLERVKELEDFIVGNPDFKKFCKRLPGSTECDYGSVVRACNPRLCGFFQNQQLAVKGQKLETWPKEDGCGEPEVLNMTNMMVTPATNTDCGPAKSYPGGFFDCKQAQGCTRDQWETSESFIEKKASQYSEAIFGLDMPETLVAGHIDAGFGGGNTVASAFMSQFKFGAPLEGYTSVTDRAAEQREKLQTFLVDSYYNKLQAYNKDESEKSKFVIGYTGDGMTDKAIQAILAMDALLVLLAFGLVFVYVVFMTESLFYGTMVMAQIFACFISAFIFYRIIYGTSFVGIFHVMAIFLIVGIGVDDMFVFLDHFDAAITVDSKLKEDIWGRLSWTWTHAAMAMGVTSLTTFLSFAMNAGSSFAGIASFGVFAACLIATNYISMILFWPMVVGFNYAHFKSKPFLCGCMECTNKLLASKTLQMRAAAAAEKKTEEEAAGDADKPLLVRFFEHQFANFILHNRLKIVIIFFGFSIGLLSQLPKLESEKQMASFLPDTDPIMVIMKVLNEKFTRGGGDVTTLVSLVFGFDKEPIYREGTDPTGSGFGVDHGGLKGDDCERYDDKDVCMLGKVKWNKKWYTDASSSHMQAWNPATTKGFRCFVQMCDAAEVRDSSRHTGGLPQYKMKGCFPRDVKRYILDSNVDGNGTKTFLKATDGTVEGWKLFIENVPKAVGAGYLDPQEVMDYAYAENFPGNKGSQPNWTWRFFQPSIRLTSNQFIDYKDGLDMVKAWEDWYENQMTIGDCASTADMFYGFVYSESFTQFQKGEVIISEMWQGIITSLGVALFILVLVTGNIFIGVYAALCIAMIVFWVMSMIPICGWELGMTENIMLVLVPGLSVDYVAHMAEAYNGGKYDDREHRVIHMLEHSGVSVVSGSISTLLAASCLFLCKITFFTKFGNFILFTISFSLLWALFCFPSLLALIGPVGVTGDFHRFIHPNLQREMTGKKLMNVKLSRQQSDLAKNQRCYSCFSKKSSNPVNEVNESDV